MKHTIITAKHHGPLVVLFGLYFIKSKTHRINNAVYKKFKPFTRIALERKLTLKRNIFLRIYDYY